MTPEFQKAYRYSKQIKNRKNKKRAIRNLLAFIKYALETT